MYRSLSGLLLILTISAFATPALAVKCGNREKVVEHLQSKYSEQLTVGGLQRARDSMSVMEVWSSQETGTYTVLLTAPDGITCIVAAGTDFFEATRKSVEKGTAS